MTIPNKYTSAPPSIISFDFTDVQAGTGINSYYGAGSIDSSGSTFFLTNKQIFSGVEALTLSGAGPTTTTMDLAVFQRPLTAKGTALFSFAAITSAVDKDGDLQCEIFHVDSSGETSIVSAVTTDEITENPRMYLFKMPLTEKLFKKGDILRIKLTLSGTAGGVVYVGTDSGNAQQETAIQTLSTTEMQLLIPFKLDL
ncbi:hypothetical protein LCGC14_0774270 [marine sediment metagenome]|uniref:Xaa-Pro dipeptidyl-peptidase C-terminal domain-containing protein n=1 Tax=marine sediment metagenome TaxID=412755 RepID=A0A0F9Q1M2_9ZZZZ